MTRYFDFRTAHVADDETQALCATIIERDGARLPAVIAKYESRADDIRTEATALRSRGNHDAADAKDAAAERVQRVIDCLRAWIARRAT